MNNLIHHFLESSASVKPDKVALIHDDNRATYEEINCASNKIARWLRSEGVGKGDRIIILFPNSFEYVAIYYGILKAGAVAVPLSTDVKEESLKFFIRELEPKAILFSKKNRRILLALDNSVLKNIKVVVEKTLTTQNHEQVVAFHDILKSSDCANLNLDIKNSSLSTIIYTSGSTGTPKGVMLSHKNIVANTQAICQSLEITESDIQMVILPFFYVMGKSLLNTHFAKKATVVINNKFAYPATVLKQMVDERVTSFSGVPSTYAYLLYRSPLAQYRDKLVSLRYCSQAGGHMALSIKEDLKNKLPEHCKIFIMYGATEASARLTTLNHQDFSNKIKSVGKPVPGVSIKVKSESGQDLTSRKPGELVAHGDNIMMGYWNDPVNTSEKLQNGAYHTGDIGYMDDDGYFYVEGRKDNLVKVGGHRINPQEIEDAFISTNLVVESIILSLPDDLLGNRIVAVIVKKNTDTSEKEIMEACSMILPKFKLPSQLVVVKSLPKKMNGKVDKGKCFELISTDSLQHLDSKKEKQSLSF